MLTTVLGGIGLFLLGMMLITDGLKVVAGDKIKSILGKLTNNVFSAISLGTVVTAIVQSSSATTVTTIGFVSAGLLSFRQAIGVILGSNLGTTSTSWIVATIGLKLKISALAFPLVGLGVLVKMLSKDRYAAGGMIMTGFGLLFIGIDTLQLGMKDLGQHMDLSLFAGDTVWQHFLLAIIGVVMTVIVQSSSAAVATTLIALSAGTINLPQAMALVVGQNVGTTITATIACIGSTIAAKRTAFVHVFFNIITGIVVFMLIPVLTIMMNKLIIVAQIDAPVIILAIFHTGVKLFGIIIFLPFIEKMANFTEKLIPEKNSKLTKYLDGTVAQFPAVAMEASYRSVVATLVYVLGTFPKTINKEKNGTGNLETAKTALEEIRGFFKKIPSMPLNSEEFQRYLAIVHSTDHIEQMIELLEDKYKAEIVDKAILLEKSQEKLANELSLALNWLSSSKVVAAPREIYELSKELYNERKIGREKVLLEIAKGELLPEKGTEVILGLLWLDSLGYHLARIIKHLNEARPID